MADRSGAGRPAGNRRGLGPGLTTFLVVDVILVLTFVALMVLTRDGGAEPQAAPSPTASEPAVEPETTPDVTAPAETEAAQALPAFVLPSGNIWCEMSESEATCTILTYSYPAPTPPEGCTGTAGNLLRVTPEGAGFVCMDAPAAGPPEGTPELTYGAGSTIGEMTCLSSRNGVFCRHNPSGAGFSLARAGTQFF